MGRNKEFTKHTRFHLSRTQCLLLVYDAAIFALSCYLILVFYGGGKILTTQQFHIHALAAGLSLLLCRFYFHIYGQVWRYGGIQCYIRLLTADACAGFLYLCLNYTPLLEHMAFARLLALMCINCLLALCIRMAYRYIYKTGRFAGLLELFSLHNVTLPHRGDTDRSNVFILGAGKTGVALAEELLSSANSHYAPQGFIEIDSAKVGRSIHEIPVFSQSEATLEMLKTHQVQEIIFAVPNMEPEKKKELYARYTNAGFRVRVYDYPTIMPAGKKQILRDFDPEELLFRNPRTVTNEETARYYQGKVVMITGGGGSIGSELCRQVAKMHPRQLIILDVYENGAYDVQQELKIAMGGALDLKIVIVSVCNRAGLERAFAAYRPQIVIHAAAHKHVPLMESDCVEAVENNVFGTLNTVELAEKYHAERFLMVSTDKAVNPTNIMGATKRMCEMIVLSHQGDMVCSATRFGNVLGSAGSVIPLFKKQIASGGPVTITDKRIIRYFMTIPEAAQVVLQSGAMAQRRELFVLDMGQPVRILDLAQNMIQLSGQTGIEIIETGLRPGEKLYEELLVKTEELDKTENGLIFREHVTAMECGEIQEKLDILQKAVDTGDNEIVRQAMKEVVPTYKSPEEVNSQVSADKTA